MLVFLSQDRILGKLCKEWKGNAAIYTGTMLPMAACWLVGIDWTKVGRTYRVGSQSALSLSAKPVVRFIPATAPHANSPRLVTDGE